MPDPDSQVCCHCHNGEKINRKRYLFSIQKILFCMRIWLDWLCQPICLAEGKMDPLLSWSGKIQFNPFVLINCSSGHHSSVLHSPHILSWIQHSHVHIQGLWGAKRREERIIISICSRCGRCRSGSGRRCINQSISGDTRYCQVVTLYIPQKPVTFIYAV